jgi:hypothetical protein
MIEGAVRLPRPSPFDKLRGFGALQNDVENPSLLFPYKGKTKQLFLSVKLTTGGKTWIPVPDLHTGQVSPVWFLT